MKIKVKINNKKENEIRESSWESWGRGGVGAQELVPQEGRADRAEEVKRLNRAPTHGVKGNLQTAGPQA